MSGHKAKRIRTNSDGTIYVPGADQPITERHKRIDELLKGYDPYLELQFIPPGERGALDTKPWRVVHRPPNRNAYVVFYADDADERMLARIIRADNAQKNVLTEMEAMNKAREAIKRAEEQAALRESHALAASIFRSPKIHYKHGGVDFGEPG
jgi:hypothetical protein